MPLSSHNCFVLRGRGDPYKCLCHFICPLQAHSCFSPGLLTPVLFLPEPPSAYCSPHQTPLKCLRFHFRGWCKRDKSQRHLKSHFPACLCWVGWRGRHSSPDITENILAQVCSFHFSSLFFPEGPAAVPSAPAVAASEASPSLWAPASSPSPWNWGPLLSLWLSSLPRTLFPFLSIPAPLRIEEHQRKGGTETEQEAARPCWVQASPCPRFLFDPSLSSKQQTQAVCVCVCV